MDESERKPLKPSSIFTKQELALALALVESEDEAEEHADFLSRAATDDEGIGGGVTFETLALLHIAAEDLLRKVRMFTVGPHRSDVDLHIRRMRDALRGKGRVG